MQALTRVLARVLSHLCICVLAQILEHLRKYLHKHLRRLCTCALAYLHKYLRKHLCKYLRNWVMVQVLAQIPAQALAQVLAKECKWAITCASAHLYTLAQVLAHLGTCACICALAHFTCVLYNQLYNQFACICALYLCTLLVQVFAQAPAHKHLLTYAFARVFAQLNTCALGFCTFE